MVLHVHAPAFPLNQYISGLIYYDGIEPTHNMDRFLPDGNTEIIFDLTDNPQYIYDNETLKEIQTCRHAWASGVRTKPITIPSGRGSRMLIVAFKKGRAYPFYPIPMSEITDVVVGADLVFGQDIINLREQLLAAPSIKSMFQLVEIFLLRRAGDMIYVDTATRCVEYALSSILHRPDKLGFDQLSDQIGYSQKHFISLFRKQVGIPPKQYMKIIRFQQAVIAIEQETSTHWSEIAARNGFYDQSHFIHEFRTFSGFTPGEYLKRKTDMLNYVPVA